jgi:hypothetical protein
MGHVMYLKMQMQLEEKKLQRLKRLWLCLESFRLAVSNECEI